MDERSSAGSPLSVVNALLVLNLAVFGLWVSGFPGTGVMAEHFLVSWTHLAEGRPWVLLTSVFSHTLLIHLVINLIVLMSFGPPLEHVMGSGRFLAFYLVAGVVGAFSHAATSNLLMGTPEQAALGASSALAGVLLLYSLAFPRSKVLFFFVIPLPAIVAAIAFVAIDIWGLMVQMEGGGLPIGHGAHLGGALVGAVYFVVNGRALRNRRGEIRGL